MHDPAHIDVAILGARPKVVAALLRYFHDLDFAEEAFQEACLRALQMWPQKGLPVDPTAWLVMVGRNAALDSKRRNPSVGFLTDAEVGVEFETPGAAERRTRLAAVSTMIYRSGSLWIAGFDVAATVSRTGALRRERRARIARRTGSESREALKRAIALAKSVAEAKLVRRELDRLAII